MDGRSVRDDINKSLREFDEDMTSGTDSAMRYLRPAILAAGGMATGAIVGPKVLKKFVRKPTRAMERAAATVGGAVTGPIGIYGAYKVTTTPQKKRERR